jgi:AcrR family transcriptional regulator
LNGRSKKQRSDEKRAQILSGAASAIRRHGLRKTGMREIAEASGLSTGNLYYYFRDKGELVYFCQDQTLDELLRVAEEARAVADTGERVAVLVRGHLRALHSSPIGTAHLELDELGPAAFKKLVKKRDEYEHAVRALVADGQKRGALRAGDPKLIAFGVLGALNWSARWFRADGGFDVETVAETFVDQILYGLKKK